MRFAMSLPATGSRQSFIAVLPVLLFIAGLLHSVAASPLPGSDLQPQQPLQMSSAIVPRIYQQKRLQQQQQQQSRIQLTNADDAWPASEFNAPPPMFRIGMSAWSLIALIMFVILLGMAAYYGVLCYPIFCPPQDTKYANMPAQSGSTSSSSSSGSSSGTAEKHAWDNSRATTPSKSHESGHE